MANENMINEGKLEISDSVLTTFVEKIIADIRGVAICKKKKSVKFTNVEGGKKLDLALSVNYGMIIPDVVRKLQKEIKINLKNITGITITEVNVVVDSLNIDNVLEK